MINRKTGQVKDESIQDNKYQLKYLYNPDSIFEIIKKIKNRLLPM